jgi:hypothetical protein
MELEGTNLVTKDLSEEELISLRDEVSKYMIEGDLVTLLDLGFSMIWELGFDYSIFSAFFVVHNFVFLKSCSYYFGKVFFSYDYTAFFNYC